MKNEAVLQERRLKMEHRLISSKSALAIHSKKWRNYDLLFYFGGKQVWLSTKILITIFLWFQIELPFKSIPSLANPLSWLLLFLSYLFFFTTQKSNVILILTYFFGLTTNNLFKFHNHMIFLVSHLYKINCIFNNSEKNTVKWYNPVFQKGS